VDLEFFGSVEEFGQFDKVDGWPMRSDRIHDLSRRALPRQCLSNLHDAELRLLIHFTSPGYCYLSTNGGREPARR